MRYEVHADPAPATPVASNLPLPTAPERPHNALPIAVETRLSELYQHAATSFMDPASNTEHSFIYNNGGNPGSITSSHESNKNSVVVYPNTAGIVHSHPMQSLAHPSSADVDVAKHAKVPNYVLSRNELWVATPDGKTQQIANVDWKDGKMQLNYLSQASPSAAQAQLPQTQPVNMPPSSNPFTALNPFNRPLRFGSPAINPLNNALLVQ